MFEMKWKDVAIALAVLFGLYALIFAGSYTAIRFTTGDAVVVAPVVMDEVVVSIPEIRSLGPVVTMAGLTVTAYHAGPEEGWGDGCTTKDGTDICDGTWPKDKWLCAASPDVLKVFPFGTTIELKTLSGFWSARCEMHDQTNTRFRNRIDVLIPKGHKGHVYPHTIAATAVQ